MSKKSEIAWKCRKNRLQILPDYGMMIRGSFDRMEDGYESGKQDIHRVD
jgi:hypothetical protein